MPVQGLLPVVDNMEQLQMHRALLEAYERTLYNALQNMSIIREGYNNVWRGEPTVPYVVRNTLFTRN